MPPDMLSPGIKFSDTIKIGSQRAPSHQAGRVETLAISTNLLVPEGEVSWPAGSWPAANVQQQGPGFTAVILRQTPKVIKQLITYCSQQSYEDLPQRD